MRDPYVLVVPADSPLRDRDEPPTQREIAEHDLIGHKHCRTLAKIEAGFGRPVRVRLPLGSQPDGAGARRRRRRARARAAADDGSRGSESTALIELPKIPPRIIAVAWHRDRYRTPAARAFVETAQQVSSELEREVSRCLRTPDRRNHESRKLVRAQPH